MSLQSFLGLLPTVLAVLLPVTASAGAARDDQRLAAVLRVGP